MENISKILIGIGLLFVVGGIVVFFASKIPGIGKLPGDILVKKEDFTFYFPITTCIVISIVLSLIFYLIHKR